MSKILTTSLIIMSLLIGTGFGFYISPQYAIMNDKNSEMVDLGRSDKYFDLRYIEAMIAHHREAILLAEQVKDKTKREEIKEIAKSMLENEPKLIAELYKWRKDWYNKTEKVEDKPANKLGNYDKTYDLRFINSAIAHHESGIEMANEAKIKSTRNEILVNAFAVADFLNGSISTLKSWRTTWYGIN